MMDDDERNEEVGHAPEALPRGFVLGVLAAAGILSVLLCVAAYLLLRLREGQLRPSRSFPEAQLPAPHEVSNVLAAPFEVPEPMASLKERQRTLVGRYGWVDRDKRIVRIPVRRAMELLVRRSGNATAKGAP